MQIDCPAQTIRSERQPGNRWLRCALVAWAAVAVAACVKMAVQPERHTVYPVFATAARHWWADEPLYGGYAGLDPFRHSPTFAVAMTPFALLPQWLGGMLWSALSIALLLWAVRVLIAEVLPGPWPPRQEGLLLALTLINSVRGVWTGQSNALLLAAALFGLAAVAKRRWWTAALLLALAVFIKIWPLALVLLLVACWPRQLLGRFAAAAAALAAVPFLTRPPQIVCRQYHDWYTMLTDTRLTRWPGFRDAWTIWESIASRVDGRVYLAIQLATVAVVLCWCLWQLRRGTSPRPLLASVLSLWVAWQLLFGPGTERLTYLIIAPSASWAVVASFAERRLRAPSTAAWLMTGLLGTGGVERLLQPVWSGASAILPLGVLVFILWLMLHHPLRRSAADRRLAPCRGPGRGGLGPAGGQVVAGHGYLVVAHRCAHDVHAVDRVLHQAHPAVHGGDDRSVDPQFAGQAGDDLLAPIAQDVGHRD
jgi:hypothetical protein